MISIKKVIFRKMATISGLLIFLVACTSNYSSKNKITGYNLTRPVATFFLPDILREISGITFLDSNTIACVQDENDILFIYDLAKNEIRKQTKFGDPGDYEGIARVNDSIYVLRSDGTLFEILDYHSPDIEVRVYKSQIGSKDNEGLCYDQENNRLLIACKGRVRGRSDLKDKRLIYEFDLVSKKFVGEPAFIFDMNVIRQFAERKKVKINLQSDSKQDKAINESINFNASAIGIQPSTNKLFVISAEDYLLFIFNMEGDLEHIEALDPEIFNKAEGISFLENGDLLISNEGQNGAASLVSFYFRK